MDLWNLKKNLNNAHSQTWAQKSQVGEGRWFRHSVSPSTYYTNTPKMPPEMSSGHQAAPFTLGTFLLVDY